MDRSKVRFVLNDLRFDSKATIHVKNDSTHIILAAPESRLLWLEISPYRLIMTMQSKGKFSYRHWLERGIYGMSRYWLQDCGEFKLRNFTREFVTDGNSLSAEYELWANRVTMGKYKLELHA